MNSNPNFYYRNLHLYKYQLTSTYSLNINIKGHKYTSQYLTLCKNGMLYIKKWYAWDGPSGPTIDTKTFMRGSLVHDALYQLLRLKIIPFKYRLHADKLLKKICREDGMNKLRAWYVYHAVRIFASKYACQ